jgi:hypothetical protein
MGLSLKTNQLDKYVWPNFYTLRSDFAILEKNKFSISATVLISVVDSDTNPHWEYGSRSRRAKMIHNCGENLSFEVLDGLF